MNFAKLTFTLEIQSREKYSINSQMILKKSQWRIWIKQILYGILFEDSFKFEGKTLIGITKAGVVIFFFLIKI